MKSISDKTRYSVVLKKASYLFRFPLCLTSCASIEWGGTKENVAQTFVKFVSLTGVSRCSKRTAKWSSKHFVWEKKKILYEQDKGQRTVVQENEMDSRHCPNSHAAASFKKFRQNERTRQTTGFCVTTVTTCVWENITGLTRLWTSQVLCCVCWVPLERN